MNFRSNAELEAGGYLTMKTSMFPLKTGSVSLIAAIVINTYSFKSY